MGPRRTAAFESWLGGGAGSRIMAVKGEAGGEMKPNPDFWIGPGSDDDAICWRGEPRGTDGRAQVGACPASGA